MKKVMISLLLCASFIVAKADAPSAAEGIEVIESIEMGDAEGLINALNRENPTQKELNEYISIAEKKFYSLRAKLRWRYMAELSSTLALGSGAMISFLVGIYIGAFTEFKLREQQRWEQNYDLLGGAVGAVVGGGVGLIGLRAIESYLNLNQKINDLRIRIKKAYSIVFILKDALQKRKK